MRRKMIALTLSLCLGLALVLVAADPFPKPQSKDALKKMAKANKAIKNKEYDAALALYNEVIVLEPNYAPVYFTSAQLHRVMGNFDLAISNYEKALELNPTFTLALNEYIRTLLMLSQKAVEGRDLKKAASFNEKILNIKNIEVTHPKELQLVAFQLGFLAYNMQDFNKSIVAFQRYLAIPEIDKTAASNNALAIYMLGVNSYNLQDFSKSIVAFQRYLAIPEIETTAPANSTLANYMLGVNYSRLAQPDKSNPYLEKFISGPQDKTTTPTLPLGYYVLACNNYLTLDKQIALIKGEKSNDALATFDRIAIAAKASTGIQPNLAKTIELKPDLEDAFVKLGNYYFYCQDFDNALKAYNDLIVKFPTSPDSATYKSFMDKIGKEREEIKTLRAKKKTK